MARHRKSRSIRQREASRLMVDPGVDASGRYDVSPFAARGHVIEVAPKELRSSPDTSFPKRIATQRVIDRYRAHGHITDREWRAANAVWELWIGAEREARVTSGYEPAIMSSGTNQDGKIAKRIDAAVAFVEIMRIVPYRSQGVVRAVVIEDWTASDWARLRGKGTRDSKGHGLDRLRLGLQALAAFMGY